MVTQTARGQLASVATWIVLAAALGWFSHFAEAAHAGETLDPAEGFGDYVHARHTTSMTCHDLLVKNPKIWESEEFLTYLTGVLDSTSPQSPSDDPRVSMEDYLLAAGGLRILKPSTFRDWLKIECEREDAGLSQIHQRLHNVVVSMVWRRRHELMAFGARNRAALEAARKKQASE